MEMRESRHEIADPDVGSQSLVLLGPRARKVPVSLREGYIGEVPKKELNVRIKVKKPVIEKVDRSRSLKTSAANENHVVQNQQRAERKRKAPSFEVYESARKEESFAKEASGMKETKQDMLEETLISQTFRKGGPNKVATVSAAVNKPKSFKDQSVAYAHSLKETSSIIIDWEADATHLLGKLCKVFWDGEQSWFYARVINYDPYSHRYFIYYFADSTGEWIDLNKECVLVAKDILQAKVSRSTSLFPAISYEAPNELTRKALSLFAGFAENALYVEFFNDTNAAENEYAFVQASHTKPFDELKLNNKSSKKLVAAVDAMFAEKQAIDAAREEALRTTRANLLRVLYGEELLDMRIRANATVIDIGKVGDLNPSFYCAGTIRKYCPVLNQHFVVFDEASLQPRWVDCASDETLECLFNPTTKAKSTPAAQQVSSSSMDIAESKEDNVSSIDEMIVEDLQQPSDANVDSDTDDENEQEDETIDSHNCNLCERSCSMENHGLRCRVCGIFCHEHCIPEEGFNPMNAVTKLKNPQWVCWNCSDCANCAVTLWNKPLIYWNSKKQVPKGHEKALLLCGWCLYHYKHQEEYCIICYKLYVYQVFAQQLSSSTTAKITANSTSDQAPSYAADQKMIQCNECDRWIHARCEGIDDNQFDSIANGSHPIWGDEYFCPMCRNDICAQIMRQLFYLDTSGLFHHPVSELVAANYYDIIHSPMDLSTMRDRAHRGYYKSAHPLRQDVELICLNALTFNRPGDSVWNASKTYFTRVQEVFEKSPRKTTMSCHGKECLTLIEAYRMTKAKELEAKKAIEEQALIQQQQLQTGNENEASGTIGPSSENKKPEAAPDSDNIIISINIVESKQPESFATNRIAAMHGEEAWFMSFVDQCFACNTAVITDHTLFCSDCGEVFHDFCAGTDCTRMTIDDQWTWRCVNCKICELCCATHVDDADTLVLCERCDRAYHINCISPALESVPDYAFTCGTCLKCESCHSDSKALWGNCINVCWPCMEAKRLPSLPVVFTTATVADENSNVNYWPIATEETDINALVARIQQERRRRKDQETNARIEQVQRLIKSKEEEHFFQAMLIVNLTLAHIARNPFRIASHNEHQWRQFLQQANNHSLSNVRSAARAKRCLGFFRRRIRSFDPVAQTIHSNPTITLSVTGLQRVAQNASALSNIFDTLLPKESAVKFACELIDALQANFKCIVRNNDSNETRFLFPLGTSVITKGEIIPTGLLDALNKSRDMFRRFYPFPDVQELVKQSEGAMTLHTNAADLIKVAAVIQDKISVMRNQYMMGAFRILDVQSELSLPLTSSLPSVPIELKTDDTITCSSSSSMKHQRPLLLFNRHDGSRLKTLSRYSIHTRNYEEVKHISDHKVQRIADQIKAILINATQRADFQQYCATTHRLQNLVQRFFDQQDRAYQKEPPSESIIQAVNQTFVNKFNAVDLRKALAVPPPPPPAVPVPNAAENERAVPVVVAAAAAAAAAATDIANAPNRQEPVDVEITVEMLKQLSLSHRAQKISASAIADLPQVLLRWPTSSNESVPIAGGKASSSIPWNNSRTCCFCQDSSDDDALLGRILPFPDANKHMHSNCLYWCEESHQTDAGIFEKVTTAYPINMRLRCLLCDKNGASVVCIHNKTCRGAYHLNCAIAAQCILLKRKKDWTTPKRWDHGNESGSSGTAEGLARNGYLEKFMLCACHAIDVHEYSHYELWQPNDTARFLAIESRAETIEKQVIAAAEILANNKSDKVIRVGSLTIWSLGSVPVGYVATASGLHGFSTPDQLYPLHFRSSRIFWSSVHPQERATYVFDILCLKDLDFVYSTDQMDAIFEQLFEYDMMTLSADNSEQAANPMKADGEMINEDASSTVAEAAMMAESYNGPIFRVVSSDNPTEPLFSRALSTLHNRLLERVAACRSATLATHGYHDRDTRFVYGFTPEQFFGIGLPVVRRALEQSIEAVQCMLLLDEKERYLPTTRLPTDKEIKLAQLRLNRLDGNELAAERRAESCARAEPMGDNDSSQPKVMRKVLTKVVDGTDTIVATSTSATAPMLMDDEERREMEISIADSERRRQKFLTMRQEYIRDPERRLDVKRSRIHGWGLFSKVKLQQDDVIVEYVGEKVRQAVADRREVLYEEEGVGSCYLFRLDKQEIVDATRIGGIARFINHSCEPCAYARVISCRKDIPANANGEAVEQAVGEEEEEKHIVILALRDIDAGEEITYDYKFPVEDKKLRCYCGASRCSGSMN